MDKIVHQNSHFLLSNLRKVNFEVKIKAPGFDNYYIESGSFMFLCQYCNTTLDKRKKFCSVNCKNDFHKLIKRNNSKLKHSENKKECLCCEQEFIVRRRYDEKYCSNKCKVEYHKRQLRLISKIKRKNMSKVCKLCGDHFSPKKTTKELYCSKKCRELIPKKIYSALRRCYSMIDEKKINKTYSILGYTPHQLREHIKKHPNWKNVKNTIWHLDHIFPVVAFLEYGIKDFSIICCLDNLQPITGKENCSKNGKYDKQKFENWLKINLNIS